MILFPLDS